MSTYLTVIQLAQATIDLAKQIEIITRRIWPVIRDLKEENEIRLIKSILDKVDILESLNKQYLRTGHLTELDLTNENYALGDDIMNLGERLWPTIKQGRNRIVIQDVLDLATAANRILIINRAYAEKKVIDDANQVASKAFEEG